ncbi:hypothetical protein DSO57_1032278 [Entomophthora muscae]|uniref:Uncharacterized protein n=1 Tax=Entomophthora muscae TaxID=34485 RepID=A0ACC2TYY7_9FUNG|nr:hypothetical protein DSO57_1032278 [Entomophthora muscae]
MKITPAHKNFSLSYLPDSGIVLQAKEEGPLPPPTQEPTLPEIIIPPIEEEIANLLIVPTVLNHGSGPCLLVYPLGTLDLEQVMVVALRIARDGAFSCLQLQFS